jgi:hypothetical protein
MKMLMINFPCRGTLFEPFYKTICFMKWQIMFSLVYEDTDHKTDRIKSI